MCDLIFVFKQKTAYEWLIRDWSSYVCSSDLKDLFRPGRLDRRVVVHLPDKNGREAILKVHTRKVPLADDVDLAEIAQTTPGVSGADIKNLVNEAALLAARREQDKVYDSDFIDALETIVDRKSPRLNYSPYCA